MDHFTSPEGEPGKPETNFNNRPNSFLTGSPPRTAQVRGGTSFPGKSEHTVVKALGIGWPLCMQRLTGERPVRITKSAKASRVKSGLKTNLLLSKRAFG